MNSKSEISGSQLRKAFLKAIEEHEGLITTKEAYAYLLKFLNTNEAENTQYYKSSIMNRMLAEIYRLREGGILKNYEETGDGIYEVAVSLGEEDQTEEESEILFEILRLRAHITVERNATIAKKVKEVRGYKCECCEFDFEKKYGQLGKKYIEAHHLTPVAWNKGEVLARDPQKDFVVLCANCHRMIHRLDDVSDLEMLKDYMTEKTLGF